MMWSTALLNTAAPALWAAYGYLSDYPFVLYPNLLGTALGAVQIGTLVYFRQRKPAVRTIPSL